MITAQKHTPKPRSSFNKQTKRERFDRERRQAALTIRQEIEEALRQLNGPAYLLPGVVAASFDPQEYAAVVAFFA